MTKEVLTKENIAKDVLAYVKRKASAKGSYFLETGILSTILLLPLGLLGSWKLALLLSIAPVVSFLWYFSVWRAEREERKSALQGDFTVIKDKLSHVGEETIHEPRRVGRHTRTLRTARFLYFPCGQWRITSPNYTWSQTFYMSGQGIENTSLAGDEFYLAILNCTQEICAVYNTKFFEYNLNIRSKE